MIPLKENAVISLLLHINCCKLGKADTSIVPPNFGVEVPQSIAVIVSKPEGVDNLIVAVGIFYIYTLYVCEVEVLDDAVVSAVESPHFIVILEESEVVTEKPVSAEVWE